MIKILVAFILFVVISPNVENVASTAPNIYKKIKATKEDRRCLAENIYREARGEPYHGQIAVGQVTLNRVLSKNYPRTICEVVFQKAQFSWTKDFKSFIASDKFLAIANRILSGEHVLHNFHATHFHAVYVKPKWSKKLFTSLSIGNHIFYNSYERFN